LANRRLDEHVDVGGSRLRIRRIVAGGTSFPAAAAGCGVTILVIRKVLLRDTREIFLSGIVGVHLG